MLVWGRRGIVRPDARRIVERFIQFRRYFLIPWLYLATEEREGRKEKGKRRKGGERRSDIKI